MKKKTLLGLNIFRRTYDLEKKITSFLLNIIQAGILYGQAMNSYTLSGVEGDFKSLLQKVSKCVRIPISPFISAGLPRKI